MKTIKLISIVLILLTCNKLYCADFYVDGENVVANDTNPGTLLLPLKTIDGAKNLIRTYKQSHNPLTESITVWIRKGSYSLSDTISFTSLDSGTSQYPITYRSYQGETASLSGKKNLLASDFQLVTSNDPLWNQLDSSAKGIVKSINLTSLGITDFGDWSKTRAVNSYIQLFINDNYMPIARWPDEGEMRDTPILKNSEKVILTGITTPAVAGEYVKNAVVDGVNSFKRTGLVDGKQYYLYRNAYTDGSGRTMRRWLLCTQTSGYPANGLLFWYRYYDFGTNSDYPLLSLTPNSLATGGLSLSPFDTFAEYTIDNGFIGFQKADTTDSFYFLSDRIKRWSLAKDMIAQGFFAWLWDDSMVEVKTIDTVNRKVVLKSIPAYGIDENNGGRFFMFNLIEEITKPGEWYLDKSTGKLYIWPTSDFNSSKISISYLNKPLFSFTDTKYLNINALVFDGGKAETLSVLRGQYINIHECQFLGNGTLGISLNSTTDTVIQSCVIKGSGGGAISGHNCGSRPLLIECNNLIENCDISQLGKRKFAYTMGVAIDGTGSDSNVGFKIYNNEFHDMPHTAIMFSGNEHKIFRNKIYDVCKVTSDAGAIYTGRDWSYRGNLIKNNFIYNVNSIVGDYVSGVYYDDCVSGVETSGNIIYNVDAYGILHGGGRDDIVKNNIFYKCKSSAYFVDDRGRKFINNNLPNNSWNFYDRIATWGGFDYQSEPWKSKYPLLNAVPKDWSIASNPANKWLHPGGSIVSKNIGYQNGRFYAQGNYITPGEDLKPFLLEYANNVEDTDPLFKDKDNLNFELMPNSPAYSIPGFEAIPFNQIGIQYPISATAGSGGVISPIANQVVLTGATTPAVAGKYLTFNVVDGVTSYKRDGLVDGKQYYLYRDNYTDTSGQVLRRWLLAARTSGYPASGEAFWYAYYALNSFSDYPSLSLSPMALTTGSLSVDTNSIKVMATKGLSQTFTISPSANYVIDSVLVDGVNVGSVSSYTFQNVTTKHSISATFKIKTNVITASTDTNGSISPSGSVSVNFGASQTFSIIPNTNYDIDTVYIDGVNIGASSIYTFTNVVTSHTVNATFKTKSVNIQSSAGANGNISPSGNVMVNINSNQVFTITPDANFDIEAVFINGVNIGPVNTYTFTNVNSTQTINVTFKSKIITHAITATAGQNGTISPNGVILVNHGVNQTFSITPIVGYAINDVLVNNLSVGAISTYTFNNISADQSIAVTFKKIEPKNYTISASFGVNGGISPYGSVLVSEGANQTFDITPSIGYEVEDVLINGTSVGSVLKYTFNNVGKNQTISVTFKVKTYLISANIGVNGIISPIGNTIYDYGSNQIYSISPNLGYQIENVLVDGISVGALNSYIFNNITSEHSINATFKKKVYVITATSDNNGAISPAGITEINDSGKITYQMKPKNGYKIKSVLVDGKSIKIVSRYTFRNVQSDHSIDVKFEPVTTIYRLIAKQIENSNQLLSIQVSGGFEQSFTLTPGDGLGIDQIIMDGNIETSFKNKTFNSLELIIGVQKGSSLKLLNKNFESQINEIAYIQPNENNSNLKINLETMQYSLSPDLDFDTYNEEFIWSNKDLSKKPIEIPYESEGEELYSLKILSIEEINGDQNSTDQLNQGEIVDGVKSTNSSGGGCVYVKNAIIKDELGDLIFIILFALVFLIKGTLKIDQK